MKSIWLSLACLIGSPLLAETLHKVEFQFPPSNSEWKLLVDIDQDTPFVFQVEESEEVETVNGVEEEETTTTVKNRFKVFTHREGDALELFTVVYVEVDNEGDEPENQEMAKKQMEEMLNNFLPNHRFVASQIEGSETDGLAEWAVNDGEQDMFHGYARTIKTSEGCYGLNYLTTAVKSECNRALWLDILNQAFVAE